MTRKLQNIGVTRGMVSFTAWSMIAGVAWRTSVTYFFSSRPKPRSALWRSKTCRATRVVAVAAQRLQRNDRRDAVARCARGSSP